MINVNSSTHAFYTLVSSNQTVVNSGIVVCKNNYINSDPNLTPWVGIYDMGETGDPARMGIGAKNWNGNYQIDVVIQEQAFDNAEDVKNRLNDLKNLIFSVVNCNHSLENTVATLLAWSSQDIGRDLELEDSLFTERLSFNFQKLL